MRVLFNSQVADIAADKSPLTVESAEDTISRLEDDAIQAYHQHHTLPETREKVRFLHFKHQYINSHI